MRFTNELKWNTLDFIVIGMFLGGTIFLINYMNQGEKPKKQTIANHFNTNYLSFYLGTTCSWVFRLKKNQK